MLAVPGVTPVTTPDVLTVATDVLLLLHTPDGVPLVSVSGVPMHTRLLPVVAPGAGTASTVTTAVTAPEAAVYVIVAVPATTPVTTPDELTVATAGVLLLHVPPGVASASVVVPVTHTVNVPVMGAVTVPGFTVKFLELMLKKTLPAPFTLKRAVVVDTVGFGTVILAVPVLGNVPTV